MKDFNEKINRLRLLLDNNGIDGILITQQKNFSWLTSGRGYVNQATEQAIATILVTLSNTVLIVNNIESARLLEEEMKAEFDQIEVFPWYQPEEMNILIQRITGGGRVEPDTNLESELIELRTVLTDKEKERIIKLGLETAEAIEATAFEIQLGQTEYEIAARLAYHCLLRGIEPIVNLIAVDERVYSRRHPLPTKRDLQKYAMLVVCGRRNGQIISATRLVHFGQPEEELVHRQRAVAAIDAALIQSTRPGATHGGLFEEMKAAYHYAGFPDEWQFHHQGGLSGYHSREQIMLPNSPIPVLTRQVYAWNPSIAGVKSEDTILVGETENIILTCTGNYPIIEVGWNGSKIKRPDILVR